MAWWWYVSLSLYVWKVNISPTWQNGTNKFERYYFVYPTNVWNFLIWPENYLDRTLSHSLCVALWFTSAKWWLTTNLSPAQVHCTHAHTQQIASHRNDDLPAHHSSESLLEKSEWVSELTVWRLHWHVHHEFDNNFINSTHCASLSIHVINGINDKVCTFICIEKWMSKRMCAFYFISSFNWCC